jgi:hypothetical protein
MSYWDNENRRPRLQWRSSENTRTCDRCLQPFEVETKLSSLPRNSTEYEMLRKALKIQDHTYLPVVCDGCCDLILASAPTDEHVETVPNALQRALNAGLITVPEEETA